MLWSYTDIILWVRLLFIYLSNFLIIYCDYLFKSKYYRSIIFIYVDYLENFIFSENSKNCFLPTFHKR